MKSMTLTFLMNERPHDLAGLSLKNDKWLSNWWGPLLSIRPAILFKNQVKGTGILSAEFER